METSSSLLRLPRELRDEIFDFAFDDVKQERVGFACAQDDNDGEIRPPWKDLPPLCNVSYQVYLEATPRYLNRMVLSSSCAASTSWLLSWLAAFPVDSGFRCVRHLAFRNFHGLEQKLGYQLISSCPNLRTLNIMFGDEYANPGTIPTLSFRGYGSSMNAYESLDNIMLDYQLHRLIDLPRLECLDFGFHDWDQPVSMERARQIKEWLTMGFSAKGRKVTIQCKQMQWGTVRPDNYLVAMFGRWTSTA